MRRLLKFLNYAAQQLALIDFGKTIKRWGTKGNIKKQKERLKNTDDLSLQKAANNTKKKRNRLISKRLRFLVVIPTGTAQLIVVDTHDSQRGAPGVGTPRMESFPAISC